MPWDAHSFSKHNHSLDPAKAGHAARIANAVLRGGAPEGESIAVANKWARQHRDAGGAVDPTVITPSTAAGVAQAGLPPQAMPQRPVSRGGPVMAALAAARRYATGGAPAASYLAGTAGSPLNPGAVPTYTPQQAGGTGSPAAMGINPASGLMNVPQTGAYTLDPTTGALTPGAQSALASYAMRGLTAPAAAPTTGTGPATGTGTGGVTPQRGGGAGTGTTATPGTGSIGPGLGGALGTIGGAVVGGPIGGLIGHLIGQQLGGNSAPGTPGEGSGVAPGGGDPSGGGGEGSTSGLRVGGPVPGFQMGGMSMGQEMPSWTRMDAGQMNSHPAGLIQGPTGGRADHVPMSVASGSYVVPADVVSGAGGGNTMAGGHALDAMMKGGPYGTRIPTIKTGHSTIPRPPGMPRFARGGVAEGAGGVKVLVSHGEYIYPPHEVAHMAGGDVKRGHKMLDQFVIDQRKENVRKTAALPGPVKE